jgi:hypothetical protein
MKTVILVLIILISPLMVWGQEKCDAPVLNVGSKWVFRAADGTEPTSELIGDEKGVYVFSSKTARGEFKRFYDKKTMNCSKVIRDGKEDKYERDLIKKVLDFPLYVGKKWTYRYTFFYEGRRMDVDSLAELSAVAYEDIEVQAGKFKAIKVKVKLSIIGTSHSGVYYYWYSPEAKLTIKNDIEMSDFWRDPNSLRFELVSFELK